MKVLVCGSSGQIEEIKRNLPAEASVIFTELCKDISGKEAFGAFFILNPEVNNIDVKDSGRPVFVSDVVSTLNEMNAPENVIRINGWPGFLQRDIWEAAGTVTPEARAAAFILGKKLVEVKDVPGFISATVVSMVINEAFYALNEGVSTKKDIDLAMKAATNYPYGPFEWGEKIGWKNIHRLLQRLSAEDVRYRISFVPDPII